MSVVLMRWLLQMLVLLLIGGSPLISLLLLASAWMAEVSCFVVCQPVWPACWLDNRVVQDVWDVYRDELGVVPGSLILL